MFRYRTEFFARTEVKDTKTAAKRTDKDEAIAYRHDYKKPDILSVSSGRKNRYSHYRDWLLS